MRLRGVEFGSVFNASGARGFAGEGYWFHRLWRPFGLSYEGSTFVSKTTTLTPRGGNMVLGEDHRPARLLPDCIVVKPFSGVVLNAVGLSGPGLAALATGAGAVGTSRAAAGPWAAGLPEGPVVLSVMSVADTSSRRTCEVARMVSLLEPLVDALGRSRVAIQVNVSCPNVGVNPANLAAEARVYLNDVEALGVGVMVKLNAIVPVDVAVRVADHPACDAVVVSNTIPWGKLPDRIDWAGIFGTDVSPLARYGGGGLSGAPLLPVVVDWIAEARRVGLRKPVVGGGGILSEGDADRVLDAGASAVELGSVSILRPWRVRGIIRHVDERVRRAADDVDRAPQCGGGEP